MNSQHARLALLSVLLVGACAFHGLSMWREAGRYLASDPVAGRPLTFDRYDGTITELAAAAQAAGIRAGERLVAVEGMPLQGTGAYARAVLGKAPGSELRLTIGSAEALEETRHVTVVLQANQEDEGRGVSALLVVGAMLLAPFGCLAIGGFVVAMRTRDPLAWVLLGLMFSFAQFGSDPDWLVWSLPRGWCELAVLYHAASLALWPVWMLLFGFYFPQPLPVGHVVRAIVRLFLAVLLAIATIQVVIAVGVPNHLSSIVALARFHERLGLLPQLLQMTAIGSFFFALGWKGGIAKSADAARRLKLMSWGASISLAPSFLIVLFNLFRGQAPLQAVPTPLVIFALLSMFLFPLTLAYVIVVHRAMDVRVVLRLGLQYAMARGAVRTLQLALSALVLWFAAQGVMAGDTSRPGRLKAAALGVAAVALLGLGAKRVRSWTDRRFFREAYDAESLLTELTEQIRTTVELEPLLETLTTRVGEALHVPKIAVFLESSDGYDVAARRGLPPASAARLGADGAVVRLLRSELRPQLVYGEDPANWLNIANDAANDRRTLLESGTQLLLPLTMKGKLLGIVSLGPKLSEEPYTPRDLRLLSALGAQAALSLENSRLVEVVAASTAQRERMNREIEIARQVQERLFPQTVPAVQGLELAGRCRPAMGIGGDYYDFLALPGGRVGVAIGDVAGKGIPAALLMAGLRAALRGQAIGGISDLAQLMDHVNTLVYESSTANRYATFFYAEFNPADRVLTYCNAGHNHPMVIRDSGSSRQVLRLQTGGMVVGLMEGVTFEQAAIVLERGDLLVAFTDGISEARNQRDDEWGEPALLESVLAAPSRMPSDLIATLFNACDAFVDGAKQHDDMTLVVLRVG